MGMSDGLPLLMRMTKNGGIELKPRECGFVEEEERVVVEADVKFAEADRSATTSVEGAAVLGSENRRQARGGTK